MKLLKINPGEPYIMNINRERKAQWGTLMVLSLVEE